MLKSFIFICATFIFGCASVQAESESFELLVGKWYGEYEHPENGHTQFLGTRDEDGTYVVEFVESEIFSHFETGRWGVDEDLYWTTYERWKPAAESEWYPAEKPVRDEYKILLLEDDVFEYEHTVTGMRFRAERVDDDFVIPPSAKVIERAQNITPMQLDDTARDYMVIRAEELIDKFDQLCVQTGTTLSEVKLRAEELAWSKQKDREYEDVFVSEWSSISGLEDFENTLPLTLQIVVDKKQQEIVCSITTFGTNPNADIGRQEFDLVREMLSDSYTLGEVVVTPPDVTDRNALPSYRYLSELSKPGDSRKFGYSWIAGLHSLAVVKAVED